MPKVLTSVELKALLQSGEFDQLVSVLEDEHLECKGSPYQLEQELQKMELAKDVSALANADGGIILVGAQTQRDAAYHADIIHRVGLFSRDLMDFTQYQQVISDWILPSIPGLEIAWHPCATNPNLGVAAILVPQTASRERPFLVRKVISDAGKLVGSHFGYFERTRDNVTPMKPEELRSRMKDGLRLSELGGRLANLEEMIGKIAAGQIQQAPSLTNDAVHTRVLSARYSMGLAERPTFYLTARPASSVDFPDLFESRESPIVKLLENPPRLRVGGFDISTRRQSAIVEARLRRSLIPEYILLELWRDGTLISILPGDEHLCWGTRSTNETGLNINNLALAETTYVFCDLALKAYEYSVPAPSALIFLFGFLDMTVDGKPCNLNNRRPTQFNLGPRGRPAPASQFHFQVEAHRNGALPGTIAYKILSKAYAWFTFEGADMPYVDRENNPPAIDPAQIV